MSDQQEQAHRPDDAFESRGRSSGDAIFDDVLVSLRRIIRAIDLHSRLLLDRHGLTGPQLVVLKALEELGEVYSTGELARHVHLSQATATGVLNRLEKRGLVARNRSDVDRRRILVRATPEGKKILQKAPALLQEQFLTRFGQLHDWEQTLILSSLQHIVAMMEAEGIDATPILVTGSIDPTTTHPASPTGEHRTPPTRSTPSPSP